MIDRNSRARSNPGSKPIECPLKHDIGGVPSAGAPAGKEASASFAYAFVSVSRRDAISMEGV
ncbi:hypothetical protein BRC68_16450 [Halobacteriales archaeon QH_6_64_20]|nr:MAG: hypothetical protein BRC68_16450 [Halobacteriales archaeon QH_6_64_20]